MSSYCLSINSNIHTYQHSLVIVHHLVELSHFPKGPHNLYNILYQREQYRTINHPHVGYSLLHRYLLCIYSLLYLFLYDDNERYLNICPLGSNNGLSFDSLEPLNQGFEFPFLRKGRHDQLQRFLIRLISSIDHLLIYFRYLVQLSKSGYCFY